MKAGIACPCPLLSRDRESKSLLKYGQGFRTVVLLGFMKSLGCAMCPRNRGSKGDAAVGEQGRPCTVICDPCTPHARGELACSGLALNRSPLPLLTLVDTPPRHNG